MSSWWRLASALLVPWAAALLVTTTGSRCYGAEDGAPAPVVAGYAIESLSSAALVRNAPGLATVTVAGTMLRPGGSSTTSPTPDARRLLRTAHQHGLRAEIILSNYSDLLGDFDPAAAHGLLSSVANRRAVVASLVRSVRRQGWDGVNVDLERIRPGDAAGLVDLARRLRARLPARAQVSVDVSARTSREAYRASGYRLGALAAHVDLVQLMTYDQHGPTWSDPGPIGALDWQRRALSAAATLVPPGRLDVGVAGYGYTWPTTGSGRSLTVAQARRRVEADGASAAWDEASGEWNATLSDGTVIWWSDARSLELRRTLAVELGLHGLAVWRLGSADPLTAA